MRQESPIFHPLAGSTSTSSATASFARCWTTNHTFAGVDETMYHVRADGFSPYEAAGIVVASVLNYCTRNWPLVFDYATGGLDNTVSVVAGYTADDPATLLRLQLPETREGGPTREVASTMAVSTSLPSSTRRRNPTGRLEHHQGIVGQPRRVVRRLRLHRLRSVLREPVLRHGRQELDDLRLRDLRRHVRDPTQSDRGSSAASPTVAAAVRR